jgi:hypothetical protein
LPYEQEVNEAFDELEEGNEDALKGEYERQVAQLAGLIELINGPLTNLDRKKLITLCTIDVHARDVVQVRGGGTAAKGGGGGASHGELGRLGRGGRRLLPDVIAWQHPCPAAALAPATPPPHPPPPPTPAPHHPAAPD